MAKFYGAVGFGETVETAPGVYVDQITERNYYGDVTRNIRGLQSADQLNDNITVNNTISIVADPYAVNHFYSMKYVVWQGTKWKISSVEDQRPRLLLTLGGVFNGK